MNEAERILEENRRRRREVDPVIYAAWQPAEVFMRQGRERIAIELLAGLDVFPSRGDRCLEIGFGSQGWIPTMLDWGMSAADLYGIELDGDRAAIAQQAIPGGHLRVGDARSLPWESDFFDLVVVSTVLTSILEPRDRRDVMSEIDRVLRIGGAALIYDFRFDNPANPHVRRLTRSEIRAQFPGYRSKIRSITLLPPLARRIAPMSWTLATLLETMPFLRSHLVAVLVKPEAAVQGKTAHA